MVRTIADRIGIDPWDINPTFVRQFIKHNERPPTSRYRIGSPCRLIRTLDMFVHVILPEMLYEKHPIWACYLRSTSPRWGRSWRTWETAPNARQRPLFSTVVEDEPRKASTPHIEFCHDVLTAF